MSLPSSPPSSDSEATPPEPSANLPAKTGPRKRVPATRRVVRNFRKIVGTRTMYESIRTILANPNHQHFPAVLKQVLEIAVDKDEVRKLLNPTSAEDTNGTNGAAPTALPQQVTRTETVKKVYNEQGELVKVFGRVEVKPAKTDVIPDADYEIVR